MKPKSTYSEPLNQEESIDVSEDVNESETFSSENITEDCVLVGKSEVISINWRREKMLKHKIVSHLVIPIHSSPINSSLGNRVEIEKNAIFRFLQWKYEFSLVEC